MNPCHPFSCIQTYTDAIQYFQNNPHIETLTSVVNENNIFFDYKGNQINMIDPDRVSTKMVHPLKSMAHVFHIINRDRLFSTGKIWTYSENDPAFFEISKGESFDIDDLEDFKICEALYKGGHCSD